MCCSNYYVKSQDYPFIPQQIITVVFNITGVAVFTGADAADASGGIEEVPRAQRET